MDKITQAILAGAKPIMAAVAATEKRVSALEHDKSQVAANDAADAIVKMVSRFTRDELSLRALPHIQQIHAVCRAVGSDPSAATPEVS